MTTIQCFGKGNIERTYYVHEREDHGGQRRLLATDTPEVVQDFFELVLEPQNNGGLRVVMMNNHGQEKYTDKGIPAALLLYAARHFECSVESSPKSSGDNRYRRSEKATAVWKRMISSGHAELDEHRGVYLVVLATPGAQGSPAECSCDVE